jgi:hypothetical protein
LPGRSTTLALDDLSTLDIGYPDHTAFRDLGVTKQCIFDILAGNVVAHRNGMSSVREWKWKSPSASIRHASPVEFHPFHP